MNGKVMIVLVVGMLLVAGIIARTPRSVPGPRTASVVSPARFTDRGIAKESPKLVAAYGKLPLAFEANNGQTNSPADFLAGRDAQLERAIEVLQEELKKNPPKDIPGRQ